MPTLAVFHAMGSQAIEMCVRYLVEARNLAFREHNLCRKTIGTSSELFRVTNIYEFVLEKQSP